MDLSEIYTIKKPMKKMIWGIIIGLIILAFYFLNSWANREADKMIAEPPYNKEEMCHRVGLDYDAYTNSCIKADEGTPIEPNSGKD